MDVGANVGRMHAVDVEENLTPQCNSLETRGEQLFPAINLRPSLLPDRFPAFR